MQRNINEKAQAKRRKEAYQSAVISSFLLLLSTTVLISLRLYYQIDGFWGTVMVGAAIIEFVMIFPIWRLLKIRLKEIEGGEEDVATQY